MPAPLCLSLLEIGFTRQAGEGKVGWGKSCLTEVANDGCGGNRKAIRGMPACYFLVQKIQHSWDHTTLPMPSLLPSIVTATRGQKSLEVLRGKRPSGRSKGCKGLPPRSAGLYVKASTRKLSKLSNFQLCEHVAERCCRVCSSTTLARSSSQPHPRHS